MESRIAEFLAGELEDRAGVEEHLVACAECRSKFSIARSGWEAASEWRAPNPSGDAITATLAALEPAAPSKPLLRFLQVGSLAASVVIACAIGSTDRTPVREEAVGPVPPAGAGPKSIGLASLRPSVGLLFARDEEGRPAGELAIQRLNVRVEIRDGLARTEIEQIFRNRTDRRLEGTFQFPLPPDASISRLAMEIDGKLMEGEVVERQKARQTYEVIVRSMKDPALLEWMPGGLFQCRIFPIEARSDKRIVIAYTQALSVFDGGARYVYPLAGESARELGIGRFEFSAMIRSSAKISKAESTSHAAATIRLDDRTMRTTFACADFRPRSDLVVAFETEVGGEIQVSAHRPEGTEPGYFTAFITPRLDGEEERRKDRKLFFLIDVSGSVGSPEIEAARVVVRRMVGKLGPADRFRIGSHNVLLGAMSSSVAPDEAGRRAGERYLSDVAIAGASDVATSLETVMSEYMADGSELVYVGEGTPTWGEKDPAKIVARVRKAMGDRKVSIRTIAVGSDADKGLLETLAREFNGGAHSINASDDVAARADEIARTLGRTAISNLKAEFEGAVTETAPGTLGSLHFGERLLVTGRYGSGPAKLILTGRVHDRAIRKEFALALPEREDGNPHVKRLWAQRRLADLVAQGAAKRDETVKLSVTHQVMTPYTSFLVLENEKAYEQHQIDRTKKDADQQSDPKRKEVVKDPRRRELELLFSQAQAHFERQEYDKCVETCDRILLKDAKLSSVEEMKVIAQRLMHVKTDRDLTRTYIEQWKRIFENVESIGIVKDDETSFPARELWLDVIKSRQPKGILGAGNAEPLSGDELYRSALRFYDAGEFEKAEAQCQNALAAAPNHGAAHALMLEVQFALGKGRVAPQSLEFDQIIQMANARQQQVIFEIREALDNGTRAYNQGNRSDAERHFRAIIEYAKWLPKSDALEAQRRQAAEMLGRLNPAPAPRAQAPREQPAPQERLRDEMRVQIERAQLEITSLIREGDRQRAAGDYENALRQFEEAEFKIKSIPYNLKTMKNLLPRVEEYIRHTREAQRRGDGNQRALSAHEAAAYEGARKREILETIRHLLEQAYLAFDQRRYGKCLDLCDDMIAIDPHYAVAVELKEDVQKVRHRESYHDFLRAKVENWKKLTGRDNEAAIPYADTVVFPSAEEWREISKRSTSFSSHQRGTEEAPTRGGTMGKLIDEGDGFRIAGALSLDDIGPVFPMLSESPFATFLDPDGGGGPLAVSSPGITGTFGPAQNGSALAGAGFTLEEPSLGDLPLIDFLYHKPQVFSTNQSVAIPGTELSETLTLLVESKAPANVDKLVSGATEFGRQLEVQLQQLSDTMSKLEEEKKGAAEAYNRAAMAKLEEMKERGGEAYNRSAMAEQDRLYRIQEVDRLSKDLGALENKYQELVRERQRFQEGIAALDSSGVPSDRVAPRKALSGLVSSVAPEPDLIVISIGRDAGVVEGDSYEIRRGGTFIAMIKIDRIDRAWSSGRVIFKGKEAPKIGDTVSNVLGTPPTPKVRAITGDEVVLVDLDPTWVRKGSVLVLSRNRNYIAAVEVVEVSGAETRTRVVRRLRASPIEAGDFALPVASARELWSVLPDSIRKDVLSDRSLREAHLKLHLLRTKGGVR